MADIVVSSLLHFEGADTTTTFTDVSGKVWTAAGNAQIDTAQFKFGAASGLFDGTGDWITTPDHTDFNVGSGDFTIGGWIRLNTVTGSHIVVRKGIETAYGSFAVGMNATTLTAYFSSNGTTWGYSGVLGTGLAANTWYYWEVSKVSGVLYGSLDGVIGSGFPLAMAASVFTSTDVVTIAGDASGGAYNGWQDDFITIKGAGLHTANFTPPAAAFGDLDTYGVAAATLPAKGLNLYYELTASLPLKTLDATGVTGQLADTDQWMPLRTIVATGATGGAGNASASLPAKLIVARDYNSTDIILPLKTLSATGIAGVSGSLIEVFPAKVLDATGIAGILANASSIMPARVLSATGIAGTVGTFSQNLPLKYLTTSAFTGSSGNLSAELPLVTLIGSGYGTITATTNLVLPLLQLDASGYSTVASTWNTWVLNTRKGALTEYDNFDFNSFATFNGQVLAVNSSGIVVLGTQDLDNATAITARVRSGKDSFASSYLKRVDRAYTGLRADGDMLFRVITAEGGARTYRLSWLHASDISQRRIPIGKGPKSRYFQFEWENEVGADFDIDNLLVRPITLRRRVQ